MMKSQRQFRRGGGDKNKASHEVGATASAVPHGARAGAKPGAKLELPVLQYGSSNNFFDFKRAMADYVQESFGELYRIITEGTVPIPANVDLHRLVQHGTDPAHLEVEAAKEKMKRMYKFQDDMPKMFAVVWKQISKTSEEKLREHPEWTAVEISHSPLDLWDLIEETHAANITGVLECDKQAAREKFQRLKQKPLESLTEFKRRFDEALEGLKALDIEVPSQQTLATEFTFRLDDARYSQYRQQMNSAVVGKYGSYPEDVAEAYNRASRQTMLVTREGKQSIAAEAVFLTSADSVRPQKSTNKKHKKQNSNAPTTTQSNGSGGGSSNGARGKKKEDPICRLCDQKGHIMAYCPQLDKLKALIKPAASASSNVMFSVAEDDDVHSQFMTKVSVEPGLPTPVNVFVNAALVSNGLGSFDVLLDNQATAGVFKEKSLLHNLRKVDAVAKINGVGGSELKTCIMGDMKNLGSVWYHPKAAANILSLSHVETLHRIVYNQGKNFTVMVENGPSLVFRKANNGLFVCTFDDSTEKVFNGVVSTVSSNAERFTKQEQAGAKKALEWEGRMGFPSRSAAIEMLKNGSIINCPITAGDIRIAEAIYGPNPAALQGKTTEKKPLQVKLAYVPKGEVSSLVLHCDIMYLSRSMPFFISTSDPLNLVMATDLRGSRGVTTVRKALLDQIRRYAAEKFVIRDIRSDNEGAVKKLESELNSIGIRVDSAGTGQHVPKEERSHRTIKERARAILSSLPCAVPESLRAYLVYFVVNRINMQPSSARGDNVCPREAFTGRKVDYNRDIRVSFLEYVHVHHPALGEKKNKVDVMRTSPAVALLPTGNAQGSVKFYCLETKGLITRDRWTSLPMPDSVISFFNAMAKAEHAKAKVVREFSADEEAEFLDNNESEARSILLDNNANLPPRIDPVERTMHPSHQDLSTVGSYSNEQSPMLVRADDAIITADEGVNEPAQEQQGLPVGVVSGRDLSTANTVHEELADTANTADVVPSIPTNDGADPLYVPSTELVRRSTRQAKPIKDDRFHYYHTFLKERLTRTDRHVVYHMSVKEGVRRFKDHAVLAMLEEFQQMLDKRVWHPVQRKNVPKTTTIIRSSMFLKDKYDSQGNFEKLKARIVAGGNNQNREDYITVSSPTVSTPIIFVEANIAAHQHRIVITLDIGGAYLNAFIEADVYMFIDSFLASLLVSLAPLYSEFIIASSGGVVVKLDKALYGCIESARLWYLNLRKTIEDIGFIANPYDQCVFHRGLGTLACTICVYVDDLMITCGDQHAIDDIVQHFKDVYKDVKINTGTVHSYLGMTLDFSHRGEARVTMHHYTQEILKKYEVTGTASNPALENLFSIDDTAVKLEEKEREVFHSRVATILYLAKKVRPDVLTVCVFLASRVANATVEDWKKLERLLKYLNSTQKIGLVLRANENVTINAYIDASFAVHPDRKSHSGISIAIGAGAIYAHSSKQRLVTRSSTEAELVAMSDTVSQAIWIRNYLLAQAIDPGPAIVYQDNTSTISMAEKGHSTSSRTRHVDIRYFQIKDRIQSGEVVIEHLPSEEMVADLLTKPLQGFKFIYLREKLMNWIVLK